MSREIDERIVAMYFDNKNFESGAQQTLKTLDQLKQSCNMEGVGSGLESFSNAVKKMNLDDLRKKTDKVKSSFQTLGNVIKKTFSTALTPIKKIKSEIDELNGYIRKVFGIDLASKIVGSLENAFRGLTVAPISAGWNQYENTMDSVKTIMSSTGESLDVVNGKLSEMTEYANKTIYSLNDMTSNLGKFTNNGVKLDDATNAMIGLANATADAGQGAQQASMAMYNVSQAIGVGKMTTIDWKSLENANIATKRLKQTFIDAAVAHGTLTKKVEKDKETGEEIVKYYTKAEKGSKEMEVSVENFRETLNKGWLDKTSMMNTFAIFSGQLTADEIAALGFSKEESARLYEIGQEAMAAATEVRTFKKMMDALKESVQSGWATSFQYIFGDMEEGTNLWTSINEKIDGILSKSTENRNNILMSWRGMMKDEDGQVRKIRDVYETRKEMLRREYDEGRISAARYTKELEELEQTLGDKRLWIDYREIAIETFNNIFDIFTDIGGAVKGAWTDVFGEFNADSLKNITQKVREFVDGIKTWLNTGDESGTRLEKIRKGLSGVFTVLKIGWNIFKGVIDAAWNIIKPLLDPMLNLFAKFGDWIKLEGIKNLGDMLSKLGEKFKGLWDKLTKLGWKGAFAKIGSWISEAWKSIKTSIRTWMYDNNLGGVYEWFANLKEKIANGIQAVKDWWNDPENNVANFFKGIYEAVTGWFKSGVDDKGNETRSPIEQFFYRIKTGVDTAFKTVKEWWEGSGIPDFFSSVWESISGLFQTEVHKSVTLPSGEHRDWVETRTAPIVQFFIDLKDKLVSTFEEVKSWQIWKDIGKFFSGIWETISGLFKTEVRKSTILPSGERREWVETRTAPIVQFFLDLKDSITKIWDDLFGTNGTLTKLWNGEDGKSGIGKFFNDIWDSVSGVFKAEEGKEAPIVEFFKSIPGALESAWNSIVKFFEDSGIVKFFTDSWAWLMEKIGGTSSEKDSKNGIAKPSKRKYDPRNPLNQIAGGSMSDMGNGKKAKSSNGLTEEEKSQILALSFLERLYNSLEEAWQNVTGWQGWKDIGKFFTDLWAWLTELYEKMTSKGSAEDTSASTTEQDLEEKKSFLERIGEFVTGIIDSVIDLVEKVGTSELAASVVNTVSSIFTSIGNVIQIVSGWFERVTNTISGNGDPSKKAQPLDWIIPAVTGVLGIVLQIITASKAGNLAKIADAGGLMTNIGGQILKVSIGILLISMALKYLGSLDEQVLIRGALSVGVIGTVITVLIVSMTGLAEKMKAFADDPVTAWERVVSKLITMAGLAGMLWILMEKLPSLISAMSEAKKYSGLTGEDIMNPLLGIAGTISGLVLTMAVVQKLMPKGLDIGATVKTMIAVSAGIIAVATTLMGVGGLFTVFDELEKQLTGKGNVEENMKKFFDKAKILTGGVHEIATSLLLGNQSDAAQIEAQREDIESLGKVAEKFDLATIAAVTRLSEMVVMLGEAGSSINLANLESFKTGVATIGQTLNEFADIVLGENSDTYKGVAKILAGGQAAYDKVNSAIEIVTNLVGVFEPLAGFASAGAREMFNHVLRQFNEFGNSPESVATFISALNGIIDALSGKNGEGLHDTSGINFDGIAIVKKIYEAMQYSFNDPSIEPPEFNAKPIVDAIITAIGLEDEKIAAAVHDMVQGGLNLFGTEGSTYGSFDISSIIGPDSPLYGLLTGGGLENLTDTATTAINQAVDGLNLDDAAKAAQGAFSGFNLNVTGFDLSSFSTDADGDGVPDAIKAIEDEWGKIRAQMEETEDFQITVKPILDTTDFNTQYESFKELFSGNIPISMGAVIDIGDQPLLIDDSNILSEIRNISLELRNATNVLQNTLYNVDNNIVGHIDSVTGAVRGIKIQAGTPNLREIDEGLYRTSRNSERTGVVLYPK